MGILTIPLLSLAAPMTSPSGLSNFLVSFLAALLILIGVFELLALLMAIQGMSHVTLSPLLASYQAVSTSEHSV